MKIRHFIQTKLFLRHLALMLVLTLFLAWLVLQTLKLYTRHGEFILLPDFTGKPLQELRQFADEMSLEVFVMDSVYDEKQEKGTIKIMDPEPNTGVKTGRKIYVTIVSSVPERVPMPDLHELSVRQAVESLVVSGLKIDHIVFVEGEFQNSVCGQRVGNRSIRKGELIPRNTKVVIVAEKGPEPSPSAIPDVIGSYPAQAYNDLFRQGFNTGKVTYRGKQPADSSVVISQFPKPGAYRMPGSTVDLTFGPVLSAGEIEKIRTEHQEMSDEEGTPAPENEEF